MTFSPFFKELKRDPHSKARLGHLSLPKSSLTIQTPIFMPVATLGSIKTLTFEDLEQMGYELILHNAYHLTIRPGLEVIEAFKGMKNLTGWKKGLLTDSGGFQIFSLENLRTLTVDGVYFKDPLRGQQHFFSPKSIIDIQINIGSDIIMPLDVCSKADVDFKAAYEAKNQTTKWAQISKEYMSQITNAPFLFGIIQGGMFQELRKESLKELIELDFDGYSIGGLSVGENKEKMYEITSLSTDFLPTDKPRYLMGVGLPSNLVEAVFLGVDMFDCVIPTRNARHGQAFTHSGKVNFHNAMHRFSEDAIDPLCQCIMCQRYSRGYVHHLIKSKELTAFRLLTYHNLYYLYNLMASIRDAIKEGNFKSFRENFYKAYQEIPPTY
jgi:queuine tRNA-ribosyltransferase